MRLVHACGWLDLVIGWETETVGAGCMLVRKVREFLLGANVL